MKKPRVLINGFGRIGRMIYRSNMVSGTCEIVAINDINPENKNLAYLLQYDSTFGPLLNHISSNDEYIYVDDKSVRVTHESSIANIDFTGIDYVVEATGIRNNIRWIEEHAVSSSVKRFITTCIESSEAADIVIGVNEQMLEEKMLKNLTASISDTNALAPVYRLVDEKYGVKSGFLTTLHAFQPYQNLLDGPSKSWSHPGDTYTQYALGRASTNNIIPKSTSAVVALDRVFHGTLEKISSFSYRVPLSIVSSAVLVLETEKATTAEELKSDFEELKAHQRFKVIQTTDEPLVSSDYRGNDYSAVIDTRWIEVNNENHIRLVYWYDNEWAYASRVLDIVAEASRFDL